MTLHPEKYATEDDLQWFDIEKYSGLENATLAQWGQLIRDRVWLENTVNAHLKSPSSLAPEDREALRTFCVLHFESIKANPLHPLGFERTSNSASHVSDTPTVQLLTGKRLTWLSAAFDELDPRPLIVDPGFAATSDNADHLFRNFAHLMINMNVTDAVIKADFAMWLRKYRKSAVPLDGGTYTEKIKAWSASGVVGYKDLTLFEKISGKKIRANDKVVLIRPDGGSTKEDQNARRNLDKQAARIFREEVCELLENSDR
ncbi:hypothetical protein RCH09_002746 [Actimicrobium sp. GrIS 1.19]|uniref:DUF6387 family protein n=1 Tax=Actimicrobium sp. GrIS 1.19 TaxID=3071708 RepID=UPI002E086F56|nr:hypothetical protein [Actimicrobium sp. GrIS 1.19]